MMHGTMCLKKICATVALSVNRAVSGGQFPSEDIATLTHSLTTLLSLVVNPCSVYLHQILWWQTSSRQPAF